MKKIDINKLLEETKNWETEKIKKPSSQYDIDQLLNQSSQNLNGKNIELKGEK